MARNEMLEILSDLVQGSEYSGDEEQELLNFVSSLHREKKLVKSSKAAKYVHKTEQEYLMKEILLRILFSADSGISEKKRIKLVSNLFSDPRMESTSALYYETYMSALAEVL